MITYPEYPIKMYKEAEAHLDEAIGFILEANSYMGRGFSVQGLVFELERLQAKIKAVSDAVEHGRAV